jgi:hypothetical protein
LGRRAALAAESLVPEPYRQGEAQSAERSCAAQEAAEQPGGPQPEEPEEHSPQEPEALPEKVEA